MKLIVVSNRLPLIVSQKDGKFEYEKTSGGLVTGIDSLSKHLDFIWIGSVGGINLSDDNKKKVSDDCWNKFRCIPVILSTDLNNRFYDGFCNAILWPALHSFPDDVCFTFDEYNAYKEANILFAEKILENCEDEDIVWVHDYHLMLVPEILREKKPSLKIMFFFHTTFPDASNLDQIIYKNELLRALCKCDLISFHLPDYAINFKKAAQGIGVFTNDKKLSDQSNNSKSIVIDQSNNSKSIVTDQSNNSNSIVNHELEHIVEHSKIIINEQDNNEKKDCKVNKKKTITETEKIISSKSDGKTLLITEEKIKQTNKEIKQTNKEIKQTNKGIKQTNKEIKQTNKEIKQTNKEIKQTNKEIKQTNKEIKQTNENTNYRNEPILKAIPIGIDPNMFRKELENEATQKRMQELRKRFSGKRIILGVDRTDYIKGIPHKMKGVKRFLERNPGIEKDVVFLQIGIPSRLTVREYSSYVAKISELVTAINGNFGNITNTPIHCLFKSVTFSELVALYAISDVMLITSIMDGFNLVALEYASVQDKNVGVVVLSKFAGVQATLQGAITHNPNNTEEIAASIEKALRLTKEERTIRHKMNKINIDIFTAVKWAEDNLNAISSDWRDKMSK